MVWPFTAPHVATVPDDVAEALKQQREAEAELARVTNRNRRIDRLAEYLAERRAQNHFGDSVQITFTPRRTDD